MGKKSAPAFGGISGAGRSSLRARDAGGPGKKLLNRGMGGKRNKNYIERNEMNQNRPQDDARVKQKGDDHDLAARLGFELFTDGPDRLGWLLNMNSSQQEDKDSGHMVSVVACYFMCQNGSMFKAEVEYAPYFYLQVIDGAEGEMDGWLRRKFNDAIKDVEIVEKEDLDLKNHLAGIKRKLLKIQFWNVDQLVSVKQELLPHARRNKKKYDGSTADYSSLLLHEDDRERNRPAFKSITEGIVDLREHDVPFHIRFAIDMDVRAGHWFMVSAKGGKVSLSRREDLLQRAEPRICAFDIETTKLPLQFPNAEYDQIFMISYMIDKKGYLIINREVVSEDIDDFEYTPKPEFQGPFKVFNCADEKECLRCWFDHMKSAKPGVYVTYNGDYFDWPFIETRASKLGMNMELEIGFKCVSNGECLSRSAVHMDCLHWVNRDSYLPQGSRGLKSVTKYKLGYDPVEVDPEDMVRFASEQPQAMASYSVSDAVATYYLYMTYVHPFIFSLSTIIPMPPDEVLRKGSGTLCEMLLMVQAYKANIVAPNKHVGANERMHTDENGISHLLHSETYIGGKVEALESGVFRADIPCKFRCDPEGYQQLIDSLHGDLEYAIRHDAGWSLDDVENFDEIKSQIESSLEDLRDCPNREENPLIYHLDVAAMYPNIILTNRLQPSAIVTDEDCAACVYNKPGKNCLRQMEWVWRGETYTAKRAEYASIKSQLQSEVFPVDDEHSDSKKNLRTWSELSQDERNKHLKSRLKSYCQKVYKRVLNKPETQVRTAGVCQRENGFYYDTVRDFRDRRYEYKGLTKKWKGKLEEAKTSGNAVQVAEAADMCVLYDSLQLAHKCILNSFYGYVMRKGARWYSMEMAGVVTHCGANIIKRANQLVTKLGRPLELDTDGIWCALPKSFPEDFSFVHKTTGKVYKLSYPCAMLNVMVAKNNTNDQFSTLVDEKTRTYSVSSEMTIEFEVDGPYLAMVLPASKEEGKLIKKRYAVFNFDGSLAELKGFELKRRGELKVIKVFQSEVFDQFLLGHNLASCYDAVAAVANRWLDMLDSRGADLTDQELVDLISESSVMSKGLDEYDGRKSCAITCARRLAEFLGDGRVRDKGLVCNYIVSAYPNGLPTSERAIPVAIFSTDPSIARTYIRKWCGGHVESGENLVPDVRDIIDWAYYRERLGNAIQKIITIPAAMQHVENPVPRIKHPDWLHKVISERKSRNKQVNLGRFLKPGNHHNSNPGPVARDVEDTVQKGVQTIDCSASENIPVDINALDPSKGEASKSHLASAKYQNFAGWLASRKLSWRRSRLKRKRPKTSSDPPLGKSKGVKANLEGLLVQHMDSLTSHPWNIVSLSETNIPGLFKMWAVINRQMHGFMISVPRIFYVNSSLPEDDELIHWLGGKLVSKSPSFDGRVHRIYRFVLNEKAYMNYLLDIQAKLMSCPEIYGVYEAQIPLEWTAVVEIGCVARVSPSSKGITAAEGFRLSDLQQESVVKGGYFNKGENLGHALLFHSDDQASGRALFSLYIPWEHKCFIWVINPVRGGQKDIVQSTLNKVWDDTVALCLSEIEDLSEENFDPNRPNYEISYVSSHEKAIKLVRKAVRSIRNFSQLPVLTLLSSPSPNILVYQVPELRDMPRAVMSCPVQDVYPAIGWQTHVVRKCMRDILSCKSWLLLRLDAARYAHLPVASFGEDWIIDTCDALFSRTLRDAGVLSWIRDESQPSLACHPEDIANKLVTEEQKERVQLAWPGMYRGVCIQIQISHLAVNAVLEAATLGELEGVLLLEDQDDCGPAFRVLKGLAQTWVEDALRRNNVCADTLLRHMYRWLCSRSSRLFDTRLMQAVQDLMRKLILNLVGEMKKLGAKVVYIDSSCIILSTGKHTMKDALGYTDYILETLKKRELFQWMALAPEKAWSTLLFLDKYNFLGLRAPLPDTMADAMSQKPGSLSSGSQLLESDEIEITHESLQKPSFDYTLNLMEYLPSALTDAFVSAIAEFVWLPWKHAMLSQMGNNRGPMDDILALQNAWIEENLPSKMTEKLLRATRHIALHIGSHDGQPDHRFPLRAGSHLSDAEQGTPVLAFVKSVCHMYSLDRQHTRAVAMMRRQLLRMIHVKEFGPEAEWKDPCASLVIQDVICPECQNCQDIDICRDPSLQDGNLQCHLCGAERDANFLETRLIEILQSIIEGFLVQDVKCQKCGSTGNEHLRRQCDVCGGQMHSTNSCQTVQDTIHVIERVADIQGMKTLHELTQQLI